MSHLSRLGIGLFFALLLITAFPLVAQDAAVTGGFLADKGPAGFAVFDLTDKNVFTYNAFSFSGQSLTSFAGGRFGKSFTQDTFLFANLPHGVFIGPGLDINDSFAVKGRSLHTNVLGKAGVHLERFPEFTPYAVFRGSGPKYAVGLDYYKNRPASARFGYTANVEASAARSTQTLAARVGVWFGR